MLKKMLTPVSIVEDDQKAREIFVEWVNRAGGFRCISDHGSAEDALEKMPKASPQVIFMDINLPGMNGVECVRRLKPLLPDAQFVMLTVYEDSDHIFEALAAGASGYLLKRTPRDELLAAIKQVHEGGAPMTSYIARKVVQAFQRQQSEKPEVNELSPREWEVLELLSRGYSYKEISSALTIGIPTVNTHLHRTYEKLHVRSRGEAVAKFSSFPPRLPVSATRAPR